MPDRRRKYAERIAGAGLTPPDERTMQLLWQIVDEGVLGASNHVRLTHELLSHIMEVVDDPNDAWMRVTCAADFITETRGSEAPIVGNAVRLLIDGLDGLPPAERKAALGSRIDHWQANAGQRLSQLVSAAVATIGTGRTVIAYDYSSTVAAIVKGLVSTAPPTSVIVPESRSIAGGRRYLEDFTAAGIAVHYVLDAAYEHILGDDAVVLLGTESIRCDGSLTNTIGSRPLARLAQWRGCPVYGCGDLSKLDLRTYNGTFAVPALRGFDNLLDGIDLPDGAVVTTAVPELEIVPPTLITAFLTEHGPVPPAAIWRLGQQAFGPAIERDRK